MKLKEVLLVLLGGCIEPWKLLENQRYETESRDVSLPLHISHTNGHRYRY